MLSLELRGVAFVKALHNRRLREDLAGRSLGSIEFKHGNISAVLLDLGLPPIDGYKPYANYQRSRLPDAVTAWLDARPEFIDLVLAAADAPPDVPDGVREPSMLFRPAPEPAHPGPDEARPFDWKRAPARIVDYAAREQANRKLGLQGEAFVVEAERQRLRAGGRDDLAAKVEHVAQTRGDGLGFDILSFALRGGRPQERLIEVKTTRGSGHLPFYVTRNEVRCSQAHAPEYRLYRLHRFRRGQSPRIFVREGDLERCLRLDPSTYRAAIRPA